MSTRKEKFIQGEYYHIYNRGVDKRDIFLNKEDLLRFLQSMKDFNEKNPIGSIYEKQFIKELGGRTSKLIDFTAYCLNKNHFHFIVTPLVEKGIEKFMQRLGTGYTLYFNEKQKRSGSLFQGKFKSKHIDSNEYLLKSISYVNFNNCDENGKIKNRLSSSSLEEYIGLNNNNSCEKSIILDQFTSKKNCEKFMLESWQDTCQYKDELKNMEFD